jgi:hypothetical protein
MFHEPVGTLAIIATVLTHPLTMAQTIGRMLFGRDDRRVSHEENVDR